MSNTSNPSASVNSTPDKEPSLNVILPSEKNEKYPSNTYPSIVIENGKPRYSTANEELSERNKGHILPATIARNSSIKYDRTVVKNCSKCGFLGFPLISTRLRKRGFWNRCLDCCRKNSDKINQSIEFFYQCENCLREWPDQIYNDDFSHHHNKKQ